MEKSKYKRILLKLSGEALAGEQKTGINSMLLEEICEKIKQVVDMGVEIGIVVGGGNFWRGRDGQKIERATADYMGMLATIMNGLAVQDALEAAGIRTKLQTSVEMIQVAEPFVLKNTQKYLKDGNVVIFTGGTGHPYFTTDTGAVLRAIEINADVILLGKAIDAVYTDDPKINKKATKYDEISYKEVLENNLKVMDSTATALAKDNNIKLQVFGISDPENIVRAVRGETVGTIVK